MFLGTFKIEKIEYLTDKQVKVFGQPVLKNKVDVFPHRLPPQVPPEMVYQNIDHEDWDNDSLSLVPLPPPRTDSLGRSPSPPPPYQLVEPTAPPLDLNQDLPHLPLIRSMVNVLARNVNVLARKAFWVIKKTSKIFIFGFLLPFLFLLCAGWYSKYEELGIECYEKENKNTWYTFFFGSEKCQFAANVFNVRFSFFLI